MHNTEYVEDGTPSKNANVKFVLEDPQRKHSMTAHSSRGKYVEVDKESLLECIHLPQSEGSFYR
jgi:hypothetical protein